MGSEIDSERLGGVAMKKLRLISILGLLFFFTARAEEPGGHFVCDGVIEPGLSVDVTSVEICPGDQGSVEVDTVTSEGSKYGHYEDTDEQVSFGLSLTDVQVTEPQVFEAPDRYTAFWIKHDTINMSGKYEDCGGGTVTIKDYDMGTVQMKNCNTKKTKKPKGSNGGSGGGGSGGGPQEEEKKEGECEEPAQPDEGVAEFFGGEEAWIVCPAPKDEEDKESMWFVATHRIVTINTPKARDLKGTIKLNKVSGDESCAKWLVVNDNVEAPYSFGEAIPIVEPGHEGCGVHDWHGGEQFFGLIPQKPGEVVLESEVDPEQGSPTKKAQLKIVIVETDLDIVHPATGEVPEDNEETDGLVAVKRDDQTPMTLLKLKQVKPLNVGGKYRLTFSDNLKIWKSANRTGEVTPETEFEANGEMILFVEAMNKSFVLNDQEIVLHWKDGEKQITNGDTVSLTAVEAEFEVLLRAFIPDQWIDLPEIFGIPFFKDRIDLGDDRDFLEIESMGVTFKAGQKITIIPFKDLDEDGIKDSTKKFLIGKSTRYDKSESVPFPDQGYSGDNRLNNNPVITDGPVDGILKNQKAEFNSRPNDNAVTIELSGQAHEGIFGYASLPVTWYTLLTINSADPLKPKYSINGVVTEFPAFEIYTRKNEETAYWIWGRRPPDASLPDLLMYTIKIMPNEWTDYIEGDLF